MSYIEFDKEQLINLEYSLKRELIRTNRAGTYSSSTIIGCNTRKYHGLLVCPMENIDNDNHVMLSGLDETIIQHDSSFNLAVRKYPFNYEPKGHKYADKFEIKKVPELTYRVGGVILKKEMVLSEDDRIIIKYTLEDASSDTKLIFKPFLAFRNVHKLSKANFYVNTKYKTVENGIQVKMYEGYKPLFMQFSKKPEYVHIPDWYYNVEYQEELSRGYDFKEDLFVPGYFELSMKKGESVFFTASLVEIQAKSISAKFEKETKNRVPRDSYLNCLKNSAQQFIYKRNKKTEIVAGFPWFGRWGRDTFISLPGLTLYNNGDVKVCKDVLDTMTTEIKNGLFPNIGSGEDISMNSVDAPLWFFWALQQYSLFVEDKSLIWKEYGAKMKNILESYRNGTDYNIKMHENGLIWAGEEGKALTWMDALVNGVAVTPRIGFDVEINALWYNAIMFSLELAKLNRNRKFIKDWEDIPELIRKSFLEYFWDEDKGYLADFVTYDKADYSLRPNQIIACSLPYSPVEEYIKENVVETVRKVLLTPKGLRTLSPDDLGYKGVYCGNQEERDRAYHQGTVWPWLLGHFCEAYLSIYGEYGLPFVEKIFELFEEDMTSYGIATIPEIYDGDPPHNPKGAVSQAWSVGEMLRIYSLIQSYKNNGIENKKKKTTK